MIKFIYMPYIPDDSIFESPSTVKELTMELNDDIPWDEAIEEFKNFLRGASYVIPYGFEEKTHE